MFAANQRKILFTITLLCICSIIYAFYAEYYLNIEPCPLCIVERLIVMAIALFAFIFAIYNPRQKLIARGYAIILSIIALFGIKVAAHHEWLMNLPPDQQPLSCGMPLTVLYQNMPLHSFLNKVLQGDAECSKITWHIVGLNPPVAVIILLAVVVLLSITLIFRTK